MCRCSTIGAIIMTPLLTKLLAGQLVPIDAAVSSDVIDNYLNKFSLNLCDIYPLFSWSHGYLSRLQTAAITVRGWCRTTLWFPILTTLFHICLLCYKILPNYMQCPSKQLFDGPVLLKDYQSYSLKNLKKYINETRFTVILSWSLICEAYRVEAI